MKQKVVIRLSFSGINKKYRSKAFKIVVSQSGVVSAAIKGEGNNLLEVVGEVDSVTLTSILRKNLGQADIAYARIAMAKEAADAATQAKDNELLGRLKQTFSQNAAASSIFDTLRDRLSFPSVS